jgi:predicted metal-binding membrane protein
MRLDGKNGFLLPVGAGMALAAALSALVLLEKILPQPRLFAQATGAILLVWGVRVIS